jgi:hypothetical protein
MCSKYLLALRIFIETTVEIPKTEQFLELGKTLSKILVFFYINTYFKIQDIMKKSDDLLFFLFFHYICHVQFSESINRDSNDIQ